MTPNAAARPDPRHIADRREFGRALTELRERAGFTVRDIARAISIPPATAGDYFAGRSLPPVRMAWVLDAILRMCDVTEPANVEHWRHALRRLRRASGDRVDTTEPPYRGYAPFEPEHADLLHGRRAALRVLTDRLATARATGTALVVTGASGVGKSSLLRAGLLGRPGTEGAQRTAILMTPGSSPCRALADHLCAALGVPVDVVDHAVHARPDLLPGLVRAAARELTVVVDQFEEIFTRCHDDQVRQTFVRTIGALPAGIVLGVRSDHHAGTRLLAGSRSLSCATVDVPPMTGQGMREAITRPAADAGVRVAPDLVDLLLHDLAPCPADGLPLLSQLLLALWHRRGRDGIDVARYRARGGLAAIVTELAITTRRTLDPHLRTVADHVIARVGHGGRMSGLGTGELLSDVDDSRSDDRAAALARLAAARVVTIDGDVVRLCHRSMLDAWPHRQPAAVGTALV